MTERESEWFAVAMNAAAYLEDAANCIRGDAEAKKAALGAAKHVREKCNQIWSERRAQPAQAVPLLTRDELHDMRNEARADIQCMDEVWWVLFARRVEQAVRSRLGVAVPMVETAWQNPLHTDQLSNNPVPNWVPLYRLMGKISDPNNAQHFSAEAACKAFGIVGKEGA